jgi:hypothetical protein
VAVHESGHAVVALAFGHDVVLVTLGPSSDDALRLGLCHSNRDDDAMGRFEAAVVALSGPIAEQAFAGYPRDVRAMMWTSSWKADRAKAEAHLRGSSMPRTLGDAALEAVRLVMRHRPAMSRVAKILVDQGELSGARIEALAWPVMTRQRSAAAPHSWPDHRQHS